MTTQRIAQRKLVGFATDIVVEDGDAAYNTSALVSALVEANKANATYSLVWEQTCPAQQILAWGYGTPAAQRNQGFLWFYSMDATTAFNVGNLRLQISNARSTRVQVVKQQNDQRLHSTDFTSATTAQPTDINNMIALPEAVLFPKVGENSLLQLTYQTTQATAGVVDTTNFSIPSTVYQ
jgi:hypothetical protein